VVALQEVALLNIDGVIHDQATALAAMTEMEARFAAAWHFPLPEPHYGEPAAGAGLLGNAILSRLPITASRTTALPQAPESAEIEPAGSGHTLSGVRYTDLDRPVRQPRSALTVTVTLPDGGDLTAISTHFSHIGSGERLLQASAMAEQLTGTERGILLGDLNAPIESRELAPLRRFGDAFDAAGIPAGDERRRSIDEKDSRIDHVLVHRIQVTACRVARETTDASDHWPVIADLAMA
jgi:endonuclease/exonuclease/phosphatase family metal-dependent hydrolase